MSWSEVTAFFAAVFKFSESFRKILEEYFNLFMAAIFVISFNVPYTFGIRLLSTDLCG
jgi:hypothetical protein